MGTKNYHIYSPYIFLKHTNPDSPRDLHEVIENPSKLIQIIRAINKVFSEISSK